MRHSNIMLTVPINSILLNVIMPNVVKLNVVAPSQSHLFIFKNVQKPLN